MGPLWHPWLSPSFLPAKGWLRCCRCLGVNIIGQKPLSSGVSELGHALICLVFEMTHSVNKSFMGCVIMSLPDYPMFSPSWHPTRNPSKIITKWMDGRILSSALYNRSPFRHQIGTFKDRITKQSWANLPLPSGNLLQFAMEHHHCEVW
jgi:hypothetical protein